MININHFNACAGAGRNRGRLRRNLGSKERIWGDYLMPTVTANGITIAYEEFGRKEDPVLVLIIGLGSQLTDWPAAFCEGLVERGLRVVCFDNRDCGYSTKMEGARMLPPVLLLPALKLGLRVTLPYTLGEMARDTVGLLDALQLERAHIAGSSMGGAIAQLVAGRYPERVLSLTCFYSTSGRPGLPGPKLKVALRMARQPKSEDREAWIDYYHEVFTLIGTPDQDPEEQRRSAVRRVDRFLCPAGTRRQFAAYTAGGNRVPLLRRITAPTLAISGSADPLVPYPCGRDIAQEVPGAHFELIEGMGHDLPEKMLPRLIDLLAGHVLAQHR